MPKQGWRPRRHNEPLPSMKVSASGTRTSAWRCAAINLYHGDCQEPAVIDGKYCYYHDKLRAGIMTPSAALYPVWPLPETGYVMEMT